MNGKERARLRNREFGFVFQFYHLLPELNVMENTLLGPMIGHSWFGYRSETKGLRERRSSPSNSSEWTIASSTNPTN